MLLRKDGLAWKALVLGKEHEELRTKGIPLPARRLLSAERNQCQWPRLAPLAFVTTFSGDIVVSYTPSFALSEAPVPRREPGRAGGMADISHLHSTYCIPGLPRWCWWYTTRLPVQETRETQVRSLGREDPLEEGMTTHSSILAWRIPWTEKPGGLQSLGSHRVGHN